MQITLAVDQKEYHLFVPLNCNLETLALRFLESNSLPTQHCTTIVKLLQQTIDKISPIFKDNKQSLKHHVLNKIKEEIDKKQSIIQTKDTKSCQEIYEEGKLKEKLKHNVMIKGKNLSSIKQQQNINKTDFYQKGIQFKKQHEKQCQQQYHKLYPFQPNLTTKLNETQKNTLHQRLYSQHKHKKQSQNKLHLISPCYESIRKSDPYKKRVQQKNNNIDRILAQLIHQNRLQTQTKIIEQTKKPIRNTLLF